MYVGFCFFAGKSALVTGRYYLSWRTHASDSSIGSRRSTVNSCQTRMWHTSNWAQWWWELDIQITWFRWQFVRMVELTTICSNVVSDLHPILQQGYRHECIIIVVHLIIENNFCTIACMLSTLSRGLFTRNSTTDTSQLGRCLRSMWSVEEHTYMGCVDVISRTKCT